MRSARLTLLAVAALTLAACGGSTATDPDAGGELPAGAESGETPDPEGEAAAGRPTCATVEAFAEQLVDVEIVYDYAASSSPGELAERVDVVIQGELTGEVVDQPASSDEDAYVGYEISVDEILAGEAPESSESVVVSVGYNADLLESEPFAEAAAAGVPVIVFAYAWPDAPGGLAAAVVEGFLTACDGEAPIGFANHGGEWSAMTSLDDVAEAVSEEQPATISHADCPENADCSLGLMIDDTHVGITCMPVEERLAQEVIAVGNDGYPVGEARRVEGVAARLLVAVANDHRLCDDDVPWVAGIVSDMDRPLSDELALSIAFCEVLGRPYDERQTCDQGGPARQVTESDDLMLDEYAWFPNVVASVDRDLAAGAGPAFRLDPAAVIADFEQRDFPACFEEQESLELCRIGHADLPADPGGTVVASGVTQTRTRAGFAQDELEWTLEQLGDGPGWWVTSKTYRLDGPVSDSEAERSWERCCPNVITEVHSGETPSS